MRILQVITLYLPEFIGGASIMCHNISTGLKKKHVVKVFCGYMKEGEDLYATSEYVHEGIDVFSVNVSPYYNMSTVENFYNPKLNSIFRDFIKDFEPDVIHFHSIQALGAQMVEVVQDMGIPFVVTMHDWWWICNDMFLATRGGRRCPDELKLESCDCMPKDHLKRRYDYLLNMANDMKFILATSNYLKGSLVENGLPADKMIVNENGLNKNVKLLPKKTKDKIVFTYMGGEWPQKGVRSVVEAFLNIGEDDRYEARFYGARHYLRENQINEHKSMKVLPKFPIEELVSVLSDTDVVILPSLSRESFSLVVREAFLCGCPVITSDCGGAQELVEDGVNGFVFKTDDHEELAEKIQYFIKKPKRVEKFKKKINKNRIVSINTQVKQLEKIYHKAKSLEWDRYHSLYESDCEVSNKKSWINEAVHTFVTRNIDGMEFNLDPPFLYTLENIQASRLLEEVAKLFGVDHEETKLIIDSLRRLKMIKRLST